MHLYDTDIKSSRNNPFIILMGDYRMEWAASEDDNLNGLKQLAHLQQAEASFFEALSLAFDQASSQQDSSLDFSFWLYTNRQRLEKIAMDNLHRGFARLPGIVASEEKESIEDDDIPTHYTCLVM